MTSSAKSVQRTYIILILLQTLAASFIFSINTLFLLDAGLSNTQAFAANSFFFVGQVLFEIPTGVVADTWGRRNSYLLGAATLSISTAMYLMLWHIRGPFWAWALASMVIGLGFTFFSGAVEAWLVDALQASKFKGTLESVFAKGQVAFGAAMMIGSLCGGVIAQATDNLAVPYILRSLFLIAAFVTAWRLMHDIGFRPQKRTSVAEEISNIMRASIKRGIQNPHVRWLMLAAPFTTGAGMYVFYAMQPFILELYGNESAYSVVGIMSSLIAVTQIIGGLSEPIIARLFKLRSTILIVGSTLSALLVFLIGYSTGFWVAAGFFLLWAMVFSAIGPFRQAFINACLPSKQRATILSFDALLGSLGGAVTNPVLGRFADVYTYGASIMVAALIQVVAIPCMFLARQAKAPGDPIRR